MPEEEGLLSPEPSCLVCRFQAQRTQGLLRCSAAVSFLCETETAPSWALSKNEQVVKQLRCVVVEGMLCFCFFVKTSQPGDGARL